MKEKSLTVASSVVGPMGSPVGPTGPVQTGFVKVWLTAMWRPADPK